MSFKSIALKSVVIKSLCVGLMGGAVLAPSANALSCMRPDIARSMEQAKDSDDLYYILAGTFQSTPLPKTKADTPQGHLNGVGAHMVEAWFDGKMLSNDPRMDAPVSRLPIDVNVTCAGPWCGNAPTNGREVIAFVKVRPGQPMVLDAGACGGMVFEHNKAHVKTLRGCFDKSCTPESPSRFGG